MNILTKSIITLVALATTGLHAETFPILKDTFGSTVTNKVAKASGKGAALPVNGKSAAFIDFGVKASGYTAAQVSGARLTIFFPKVTTPGNLNLSLTTSAFQEAFTTSSIALPTNGSTFAQVPITTALTKNFITVDVTDEVKAILNSANEFGFTIKSDGTANCTISSKEGSASGYPAVLEVDINAGAGAVSGTTGTFTNFTTSNATINGPLTGGAATFSGAVQGGAGTFTGLTLSGGLSGTTGTFTGAVSASGFTGSGSGLTGLNAGNISSGTLSDGALSANVALLNRTATQTFAGGLSGTSATFSGAVEGGAGSFTGLTLTGPLTGTTGAFTGLQVQDFGAQSGSIQVGGTGANGDPKLIKFGDGNLVTIGENGVDDRMDLTAGQFVFNNGNVGIGIANPNSKLQVNGTLAATGGTFTGALTGTTGTFSGNVLFNGSVGIGALDPGAAVFNIFSATNPRRMKVETGSNTQFAGYDAKTPSSSWYMGTDTAPSKDWALFDANSSANRIIVSGAAASLGNVGIGAAPVAGFRLNVGGSILCTGFLNTSDARFKKDITSITLGLDTVKKLRPVTYDWRRDEFPDRNFDAVNHSGFIAQEIGQVLPNVVAKVGGGYLSVNYVEVIPVLTRAIQELAEAKDAEIAALKEKLAASEARRTALDAEIQARLAKLEAASSTPAPAATTVSTQQ